MLPWYFSFHAHIRSRKRSRPSSWRLVPSRASSRSTMSWVAMPAWSVPGSQSALKPLMRFQRVSRSCRVDCSAWPMCSRPVTLGGGIMMQKLGLSEGASARKIPCSRQVACQRGS